MAQFDIADANARFSELVERALAGDEVIVTCDGKPLLKLVPLEKTNHRRRAASPAGLSTRAFSSLLQSVY